MKERSCARTWEVEAARDGRLTSDARESLELHLASCGPCARERRLVEELGARLRASSHDADEVALRRLRASTLERADATLSGRTSAAPRVRWIALALAATIAAFFVVRVSLHRAVTQPPNDSSVSVTATSGEARWSRASIDGVDLVTLDHGTIALVVRRKPGDPRVVVRVPDGEIEDMGTVFRVTVDHGRTTEIHVTEGSVVFRRRGGESVTVVAGAPFVARLDVGSTPPPMSPTIAENVAPAASPPPSVTPPKTPHGDGTVPTASPSSHPPPMSSDPTTQDEAIEEDGAYLQIVALVREGRSEEARLAAKEYLRRFPNGFRRPEVEKIAAASAP